MRLKLAGVCSQRNGVSFSGCPGCARPPEPCPEGMADPNPRPFRLVRPLRGATPRGTHRGSQPVLQYRVLRRGGLCQLVHLVIQP